MGDLTRWTSAASAGGAGACGGAATVAGPGEARTAAPAPCVAVAIGATGGSPPCGGRRTSLILIPSRSISNSTKLLLSRYSISCLISSSRIIPPPVASAEHLPDLEPGAPCLVPCLTRVRTRPGHEAEKVARSERPQDGQ